MKALLITRQGRAVLELIAETPVGPPPILEMLEDFPRMHALPVEPLKDAEIRTRMFKFRAEEHGVFIYSEI